MNKQVLASGGTVSTISSPVPGPITLPAHNMFWDVNHIHSSLVASRARHDQMLQFAAVHNIAPVVEVIKHSGVDSVNQAIERLESGKVRYRVVLDLSDEQN